MTRATKDRFDDGVEAYAHELTTSSTRRVAKGDRAARLRMRGYILTQREDTRTHRLQQHARSDPAHVRRPGRHVRRLDYAGDNASRSRSLRRRLNYPRHLFTHLDVSSAFSNRNAAEMLDQEPTTVENVGRDRFGHGEGDPRRESVS